MKTPPPQCTGSRKQPIAAIVGSSGGTFVPVLVLAQMTHAVTFAAHHAACITLVHRLFPGRLRGRGQALYTMLGYGLSGVLGGVGGGWVISHFGFAAVFWAAALSALVAAACARLSARASAHALVGAEQDAATPG